MFSFFKKTIPKEYSETDNAIEQFSKIYIGNINQVYSSDMTIRNIEVSFLTIGEYVKILEHFINCFNNQQIIETRYVSRDIHLVSIYDFFITERNQYYTSTDIVYKFIDKACELLALFQDTENKNERSFADDKNLMHSRYVVSNLYDLSKNRLYL